jgi:hypothetical protein
MKVRAFAKRPELKKGERTGLFRTKHKLEIAFWFTMTKTMCFGLDFIEEANRGRRHIVSFLEVHFYSEADAFSIGPAVSALSRYPVASFTTEDSTRTRIQRGGRDYSKLHTKLNMNSFACLLFLYLLPLCLHFNCLAIFCSYLICPYVYNDGAQYINYSLLLFRTREAGFLKSS